MSRRFEHGDSDAPNTVRPRMRDLAVTFSEACDTVPRMIPAGVRRGFDASEARRLGDNPQSVDRRVEPGASAGGAGLTPLAELRGLDKSFGGTHAVDDVSLTVERGQTLALLGENGAGKSTLIKLLAGVYQPDRGDILLDGRPIDHRRDRRRLAFIHQDHGLIDSMTVAENIALVGGYARRLGLIDWRVTRETARRALEQVGLPVDRTLTVSDLGRHASLTTGARGRRRAREPGCRGSCCTTSAARRCTPSSAPASRDRSP